MSISAATCRNSYTGDGSTTVFAYSFKVSAQTHLKVMKRLIASPYTETTLTITTDYTVSGVGNSSGGNVTLTTALPSTYTLQILLQRPVTQPTSIRTQGAYYPNIHEDALDELARVNMQQQDQLNRSIRQPETEAPLDMELPPTASRASKYLAFDSDGKPTVTAGTTSSVVATSFWTSVLDDTTAAASIATYQGDLSEDTAPALADYIHTYDASDATGKKVLLGAIVQAALDARGFYNLGLANATTTNAADSIKIQGASAALSSTNPLYINLPTVSSPGRVTRFSATSDVTINLTGAHWGCGTNGDFTDVILRVYAINDNGTLKWGVSNQGGKRSIVDTNSHTTATSVTTQVKMLVNSALSSGTWPCREVGWFLADFDDTGGAAEDLWAVQTAAGEIVVGAPAPVNRDRESVTVTGTWVTNTAYTAFRTIRGDMANYEVKILLSTGAPTSATLDITLPTGDIIDTSKLSSTSNTYGEVGSGVGRDEGTGSFPIKVVYNSTSAVRPLTVDVTSAGVATVLANINATSPITWTGANADAMKLNFSVPLVGRSNN